MEGLGCKLVPPVNFFNFEGGLVVQAVKLVRPSLLIWYYCMMIPNQNELYIMLFIIVDA